MLGPLPAYKRDIPRFSSDYWCRNFHATPSDYRSKRKLPGLTSLDGFGEPIYLGVEKHEVIGGFSDTMIGFQILTECLPNARVDDNFVSLVALALFDPKPLPDPFVVVDEMTYAQLQ